MKKMILTAVSAMAVIASQAQTAYETPSFSDNWQIGLDGGVTTPLAKHHAFFGDMRGAAGLHIQKQLSPAFALGVEGYWAVNTSSWTGRHRHVAFDNSYVGVYGGVNLMNLFGGFKCDGRLFEMEIVGGAGWGHDYANEGPDQTIDKDYNYFSTKAGLNFNFNLNKHITLSIKPQVVWNMTGSSYAPLNVEQTSAAYSRNHAAFNLFAGLSYNFGPGFQCVETRNQAEIDDLNARINQLRAENDACAATLAANTAKVSALAAELDACKNRKPEVVKAVTDSRYVFFRFSSSKIQPSQQPNVSMIADYMKKNPDVKVTIAGYASKEGNPEYNERLSEARANAVKDMLVKKYGIEASRIEAQGKGIGDMFNENSWNRVAICTLDE